MRMHVCVAHARTHLTCSRAVGRGWASVGAGGSCLRACARGGLALAGGCARSNGWRGGGQQQRHAQHVQCVLVLACAHGQRALETPVELAACLPSQPVARPPSQPVACLTSQTAAKTAVAACSPSHPAAFPPAATAQHHFAGHHHSLQQSPLLHHMPTITASSKHPPTVVASKGEEHAHVRIRAGCRRQLVDAVHAQQRDALQVVSGHAHVCTLHARMLHSCIAHACMQHALMACTYYACWAA